MRSHFRHHELVVQKRDIGSLIHFLSTHACGSSSIINYPSLWTTWRDVVDIAIVKTARELKPIILFTASYTRFAVLTSMPPWCLERKIACCAIQALRHDQLVVPVGEQSAGNVLHRGSNDFLERTEKSSSMRLSTLSFAIVLEPFSKTFCGAAPDSGLAYPLDGISLSPT